MTVPSPQIIPVNAPFALLCGNPCHGQRLRPLIEIDLNEVTGL